jgi:hypothetical protein
MSPRRVNIHVERLFVVGPRFNRRETALFRSGFERELNLLLRDRPPQFAHNAAARRLSSPDPIQRASRQPAAFGAQVARRLLDTLRDSL